MLCTRCGRTDRPDVLVAGSDALELLGWCLFAAPGLLYCWWRNMHRGRLCPHCGSAALLPEARAARAARREREARDGAEPLHGGRLVYAARRVPWMAPPGDRLRRILRGGGAVAVGALVFAVVSVNRIQVVEKAHDEEVTDVQLEADRERQRETRAQSVRERECDRLCSEFHAGQPHSQRECVQSCITRLFTRSARSGGPADGCADLLDPSACEYVVGRARGGELAHPDRPAGEPGGAVDAALDAAPAASPSPAP